MRAGKALIFCATQRTGSTMVFQDLRGSVGCTPGFSELLYDRIVRKKLEVPWPELWDSIYSVNKTRGYFVDKVMFHYTPMLAAFIDRNSINGVKRCLKFDPKLFDPFYHFFEDAIWAYIDRRDIFAQAVSMYLAEATQIWQKHKNSKAAAPDTVPTVGYDYKKLRTYLHGFQAEKDQWQLFFQHYNITPVRIVYEEAVTAYPHYLKELLDRAELQMIEKLPGRNFLKLGDELNNQLAEFLRNDVLAEREGQRFA
jgi:LPS sulfotransferase NodH